MIFLRTMVIILLLSLLATPGCGDGASSTPVANPSSSTKNRAVAVQGNNAFALDLYGTLATGNDNLFFSPLSISTALAMTSMGARGETAAQMDKTLHFTQKPNDLHPALGSLLHDLVVSGKAGKHDLQIGNSLWVHNGHPFLPEFIDLNKENYAATIEPVDFVSASEQARQKINTRVSQQTRKRINELLSPGSIDSDTRLVLINTIYFLGQWESKFKQHQSYDEPFHVNSKESPKVPMMHQTADFGYHEEPGYQALRLPYQGGKISMVVVLPTKTDGLAELEKQLTPEKLAECLKKMESREVIVSIPRFKLETKFDLEPALKKMGMQIPFSHQADFSGITGVPDLFLSAVIHKAFVVVNEEGTEAAAATAAVLTKEAAAVTAPPTFRANHPFLFFIRDEATGSILFLGRLIHPEAGSK